MQQVRTDYVANDNALGMAVSCVADTRHMFALIGDGASG